MKKLCLLLFTVMALVSCGYKTVYWAHVISDEKTDPYSSVWSVDITDDFLESGYMYDFYWEISGVWVTVDGYRDPVPGDVLFMPMVDEGEVVFLTDGDYRGYTQIACKTKVSPL